MRCVLGLMSLFFAGLGNAAPTPMVTLPTGYVYQFGEDFTEANWATTQVAPYKAPITTQKWYGMQPNSEFLSEGYAATPPGTLGYPFANNYPSNAPHWLSMGWWQDSNGGLAGCFIASVDQSYHGTMGSSLPHPGAVRHGYFEGKFMFPVPHSSASGRSGLWAAFWFQSIGANAHGLSAELDGFELYSIGGFPAAHTTWHIWGPNGYAVGTTFSYDTTGAGCQCVGWTPAKGTPSFCDGNWHTWGLLVTATDIVTYLDGKLVWDTPNPDDSVYDLPLFIDVDTAFGGGWPVNLSWDVPSYPGTNGPGMYSLKINYIRVWANPAEQ
jgi:hypothetical protein